MNVRFLRGKSPRPVSSIPAETLPGLSHPETERLAEGGSAPEVSEFLLRGKVAGHETIPEELCGNLALRLEKAAYLSMLGRLLAPLTIPAAAAALVRPLNDFLDLGLDPVHSALIFLSAIGAGAFAGRAMADSYQRRMAAEASSILRSGRINGSRAEESLALLVCDGRDVKSAAGLLSSGLVNSERAQAELARAVYEHGTAEDARAVLDSGKMIAPYGVHMLRMKSEDSQ